MTIGTILLAIAALASAVISYLMWRSTRQGSKDANTIAAEATRISERQVDLDLLTETSNTLRDNLSDARTEVVHLRKEVRSLREETTTALANVAILSEHIREHVPVEIPFPRLRRVQRTNNGT